MKWSDKVKLLKKKSELNQEIAYLTVRRAKLIKEREKVNGEIKVSNELKFCIDCKNCMIGERDPFCQLLGKSVSIDVEKPCVYHKGGVK